MLILGSSKDVEAGNGSGRLRCGGLQVLAREPICILGIPDYGELTR